MASETGMIQTRQHSVGDSGEFTRYDDLAALRRDDDSNLRRGMDCCHSASECRKAEMRNEEALSCDENMQNRTSYRAGLLASAERELASFARAVSELFGADQARQSVEDWMQELESMDWRSEKTIPAWRHLTIAAAARLAGRVNC
jgi:hypothetical protein